MSPGYTVKDGYALLAAAANLQNFDEGISAAFSTVWTTDIPLSVRAFMWRCFLGKVATKDQLLYRGISLSNFDISCALCAEHHESLYHLLFSCRISALVWRNIYMWISLEPVFDPCIWKNFVLWESCCRKEMISRRKEGLVWAAVVWSIWITRNDIIFNGGNYVVDDIIWSIKFLVWKWLVIGKIMFTKCNFYNFRRNRVFYLK